jgi:hypothetical protein
MLPQPAPQFLHAVALLCTAAPSLSSAAAASAVHCTPAQVSASAGCVFKLRNGQLLAQVSIPVRHQHQHFQRCYSICSLAARHDCFRAIAASAAPHAWILQQVRKVVASAAPRQRHSVLQQAAHHQHCCTAAPPHRSSASTSSSTQQPALRPTIMAVVRASASGVPKQVRALTARARNQRH